MNLKEQLQHQIKSRGGWVNTHAHFDRAFSLDGESIKHIYSPLKEKWSLVDSLKKLSSVEDIFLRMEKATILMNQQGCQAIGSFIDVDEAIEDKAILATEMLKSKWGDKIKMVFMNQTLKGVIDKEARYWFDKSSEYVDIIGGLPGKDGGKQKQHLDIILSTGKRLNKRVHVHVDQLNTAMECETELLAKKTIEWGMEGKVTAIHSISLACHRKPKRDVIYKLMKEADLSVIACPIAWIDHPRTERLSPTHNAITPVDEMIEWGIKVGIGTDNINDIYKPFGDGDMWTELKVLLEACKIYDIDKLTDMSTKNGLEILGLD